MNAWKIVGRSVVARKAIQDSPLAKVDASAKRGDVGYVADYLEPENLLVVDFGKGVILCTFMEIRTKKKGEG